MTRWNRHRRNGCSSERLHDVVMKTRIILIALLALQHLMGEASDGTGLTVAEAPETSAAGQSLDTGWPAIYRSINAGTNWTRVMSRNRPRTTEAHS
jgi:hypothetical protein